ncbi:hypothetical protein Pfo_028394 [Paulownia fortunei]|nr:hypothetical protein Pfo_028394 [Paulownia fortunei]
MSHSKGKNLSQNGEWHVEDVNVQPGGVAHSLPSSSASAQADSSSCLAWPSLAQAALGKFYRQLERCARGKKFDLTSLRSRKFSESSLASRPPNRRNNQTGRLDSG